MNLYVCPMHLDVTSQKKGKCGKCGMDLVKKEKVVVKTPFQTYKPLIVIIGLLTTTVGAIALKDFIDGSFSGLAYTRYFMGGFFITFSGFKLLDLKGFKEGYETYDLLAQKIPAYGYLYPFLELLLGLFYITNIFPFTTNLFTFTLMLFSGLGVLNAKQRKTKIKCACLGTVFDLPLTTVTIVEDFGMALMALVMMLI